MHKHIRELFPPTSNAKQDDLPPDLSTSVVVGASLAGFFLSSLLFRKPETKPKLENHPMCGITTGGKEECYFDCEVNSMQLVTNPACLLDCFPANHCVVALINDVLSSGVCYNSDYYDYYLEESDSCIIEDYEIVEGTCSNNTEFLLRQLECQLEIFEKLGFITNTLIDIISKSCSQDISVIFINKLDDYFIDFDENRIITKSSNQSRLAPAQFVIESPDFTTRTLLKYENTRNRYPWVCSLRSKGPTHEHLCAVTLLAVPPGPTVVVGPAHCTYFCKNEKNSKVPPCCCNDGREQDCSTDKKKCGENPRVFGLTNIQAEIICGEWETNTTPFHLSEEKYNLVMTIIEIIRHPNWKVAGSSAGPIGGNDIAVFKVDENKLQNPKISSLQLRPACLPEKFKDTNNKRTGIHTGWSRPPPIQFLQKRAPNYVIYYRDFFKQWHFKMNILEKCEDPTTNALSGELLQYPANSYYPPGTVCAKDFSRQSCFSSGDSGSPLMVREETRPMRFYVEGILSFVKGCDIFTIGSINDKTDQLNQQTENPSTYTKMSCFLPWIADQFGMEYENSGPRDPLCSEEEGDLEDEKNDRCRSTPSNLETREDECLFPFYYMDKLYNTCILFEEDGFVFPVFRCPTRNITTKIDGINNFPTIGLTEGICPSDPSIEFSSLNPSIETCEPYNLVIPFSQCKNNCPGVRAFGIIGGGAILATIGGLSTLSVLAPAAGIGVIGLGGTMVARAMCFTPYCISELGQCCLLVITIGGLVCPVSC